MLVGEKPARVPSWGGALVLRHFNRSSQGSLSAQPAAHWSASNECSLMPSELRHAVLRWFASPRAAGFLY